MKVEYWNIRLRSYNNPYIFVHKMTNIQFTLIN